MSTKIVSKTVNLVSWKTDVAGFQRVKKQIKEVKRLWETTNSQFKATNPMEGWTKQLENTKRAIAKVEAAKRSEAAKTSSSNVALAKKEAQAREAIAKRESARRAQVVRQMTAKNPEMARMRKFYQEQARSAKRTAKTGDSWRDPDRAAKRMAAYQATLASRNTSAMTGMVGNSRGHDAALLAAQTAAMNRYHKQQAQSQRRTVVQQSVAPKAGRSTSRVSAALDAARMTTLTNTGIRLNAKYGANYGSKLKGYNDLVDRFKNSPNMKSSTFRAEVAALESAFKRANASTLTFSEGLRSLRRSIINVTAAYTAFSGAKRVMEAGQFFQTQEATMLMVTKDARKAGEELEFIRNEAYRLGLDLEIATNGFTQMAVNGRKVMDNTQLHELFTGFSEYATAMGVDRVRYRRSIMAIQQMMGKGQIYAEELKQQLAEALPGSFQIFLEAVREFNKDSSITEEQMFKMMKDGKLLAKDILPLVGKYFSRDAREGGALAKQMESNRVAMSRLNQTWFYFLNTIFDSGFGRELTDIFNLLSDTLKQNTVLGRQMGEFFGGMLKQAKNMFIQIHDWIIIIHAMLLYYTEDIRKMFKETFGDPLDAELAGRIVSFFLIVGFLKKTLGFLLGILGAIRAIKKVGGLVGALGGAAIGADLPGKGGNRGKTPKMPKGGGIASKLTLGALLKNPYVWTALAGWGLSEWIDSSMQEYAQENPGKRAKKHPDWMQGALDWWGGLWGQHLQDKQTYNRMSLLSDKAGTFMSDIQGMLGKGEITVNVKVDQGVLKEIIDTQIELSQMDMIDLINGSIESTTE